MTKLLVTFCMAIAIGAALAAETNGEADAKPSPSEKVTLTGCLKAGADSDTFVLMNAFTEPVTTSDAAGADRRRGAVDEWELKGATNRLKLREHVGHRVQLTGSVLKATAEEDDVIARLFASRASLREGVIGTTGRLDGERPSAERRRVRIDALRHRADSCQ